MDRFSRTERKSRFLASLGMTRVVVVTVRSRLGDESRAKAGHYIVGFRLGG
jgi:hypothetical protein